MSIDIQIGFQMIFQNGGLWRAQCHLIWLHDLKEPSFNRDEGRYNLALAWGNIIKKRVKEDRPRGSLIIIILQNAPQHLVGNKTEEVDSR